MKRFYLAGPYPDRKELEKVSIRIEKRTGWTCNARWLDGRHDGIPYELAAQDDVEDVKNADALVIISGESSRGGMWTELGMALAWEKPIIFLHNPTKPEPPIFAWLPAVPWEWKIGGLCNRLKELEKKDAA